MTKAQAAALLLIGSAAGVGGKAAIEGLNGKAEAAIALPFTHAVDLRRNFAPDAGSEIRFQVYSTVVTGDGRTRDVGQATKCTTSKATVDGARALMNVLAKECSWQQ